MYVSIQFPFHSWKTMENKGLVCVFRFIFILILPRSKQPLPIHFGVPLVLETPIFDSISISFLETTSTFDSRPHWCDAPIQPGAFDLEIPPPEVHPISFLGKVSWKPEIFQISWILNLEHGFIKQYIPKKYVIKIWCCLQIYWFPSLFLCQIFSFAIVPT